MQHDRLKMEKIFDCPSKYEWIKKFYNINKTFHNKKEQNPCIWGGRKDDYIWWRKITSSFPNKVSYDIKASANYQLDKV